MEDLSRFLKVFINGDTFIIFLVIMIMILLVLILILVKSKSDYSKNEIKELKNIPLSNENEDKGIESKKEVDDFALESLKATSEEDKFDENKPLIKQIDVPNVKTYNDIIEIYENSEEENAVISSEELERKKQERMEEFGTTNNQEIIEKYEEEQEKKAIISYEQLLKNASNITLSYKEEDGNKKGAPKVNKIEIKEKEVTPGENYFNEEEFLKILKEFRINLE